MNWKQSPISNLFFNCIYYDQKGQTHHGTCMQARDNFLDLVLSLCGSGAPTPKSSNKAYFFQPKHVWKSLDLYYCRESSLLLGPFCTQLVVLQNSIHPMHSNNTRGSVLTFTTLLYLFCMRGRGSGVPCMCVDVRGQLAEVSPVLLPCGPQGLNPDHQA